MCSWSHIGLGIQNACGRGTLSMRHEGTIVKLDRGFPLVSTLSGDQYRCKHATALIKGQKHRAVIGDKVILDIPDGADMAQLAEIMPRKNEFIRKDPAERALPQVLAANFDTVIIAHPLAELNIRRLERELVLAHETSAKVIIALTKADLAESEEHINASKKLVRDIASESVDVLVVSENDKDSIERIRSYIPEQTVAILIGRSGVGKSSMVNLLAGGHVMDTTPVRESDGKGRHTTVSRAMIPILGGGYVVDMPGVRGLGLWESEDGIQKAFPDVFELAQNCRFRDCKHSNEPGCKVVEAVEKGILPQARADSYRNLMAENEALRKRLEEAQRLEGRGMRSSGKRKARR